jgi:endonuclease-3
LCNYLVLSKNSSEPEREMDERERANQILKILQAEYTLPKNVLSRFHSRRTVFETLIRTVLSQATNDRNRDRAYKNLSAKFAITPKALANANVNEIAKAIRVGGLYRNKSRKIKELSKFVLEHFHGSFDFVFSGSLPRARARLMSIPGVGPKTADVVLLFSAGKHTFPVDTHVFRVSRRLKLAPLNGGYEDVRGSLESLYAPEDYLPAHLLLISLGRTSCRARNPMHKSCQVRSLCPMARLEEQQPELHKLHGSRDFP